MNTGQILCVIAAIITLIATYMFYWFSYIYLDLYYMNGIGFLKNYLDLWTNQNNKSRDWIVRIDGLPVIFYYAIVVLFTIFMISPILQIVGLKNKYGPYVGGIMPLVIGFFILLYALIGFAPSFIKWLLMFGDTEPFSEGVFPLTLAIEGRFEFWGTYILIAAGILSLIAGKKSGEGL
ncbi:MAG: hypothetical protein ACFFDO_06685 [Candidatus Thorarchaeota archaeon]